MRDDLPINPFRSARVISRNTDPAIYLATGSDFQRGDPQFIMSSGNLNAYLDNPHKWRHGVEVWDSKTWQKDFGSWLDCNLLVPELADKRFAVTPETYDCEVMECPECGSQTDSKSCRKCGVEREEKTIKKSWSNRADFCGDWVMSREAEHKQVIDRKTHLKVMEAIKVAAGNEAVTKLIQESDHQVFCLAEYEDPDTGLVIVVRILADIVPTISPWKKCVFDLKSARDGHPHGWPFVVFKNGYHLQLALYADVLSAAGYGERNTGAHLVIENEAPYHIVEPFPALTEEFFQAGRERYQTALRHYCQALKTGIWTGYPVPAGTTVFDHLQFLNPPNKIAETADEHPGEAEKPAATPELDPDEVGIIP